MNFVKRVHLGIDENSYCFNDLKEFFDIIKVWLDDKYDIKLKPSDRFKNVMIVWRVAKKQTIEETEEERRFLLIPVIIGYIENATDEFISQFPDSSVGRESDC